MAEYPQLLHTVLDTTRPRELAEFYRQLLGLSYLPGDEPPADGAPDEADWLVLVDSDGVRKLALRTPSESTSTSQSASSGAPSAGGSSPGNRLGTSDADECRIGPRARGGGSLRSLL